MLIAESLVKSFGDFTAVNKASFQVDTGKIVGLVGSNGAGKTTVMRLLSGVLSPDQGQIWIGEANMETDPLHAKSQLGYLPEGNPLYEEMTAGESIAFTASLRGMDLHTASVKWAKELCKLDAIWHVPVEELSKGWRQRIGLTQAILHDPPVLILDEPTDGLDFSQKKELHTALQSIKTHKSILISTHLIDEIELLCDAVVLLREGQCIAQRSVKDLKAHMPHVSIFTLELDPHSQAAEKILRNLKEIRDVIASSKGFQLIPHPSAHWEKAVRAIAHEKHWKIKTLRPSTMDFQKALEKASDHA